MPVKVFQLIKVSESIEVEFTHFTGAFGQGPDRGEHMSGNHIGSHQGERKDTEADNIKCMGLLFKKGQAPKGFSSHPCFQAPIIRWCGLK